MDTEREDDRAEPALVVAGLWRSFPIRLGLARKSVLRSVDLRVARASTLGLVGPNGSGKSTLLRIIAGVDRATAGSVSVFGRDARSAASRARTAYLPEDSPFPGELSALSALDLLGALAGLPRKILRVRKAELLEEVGLLAHARTPLRKYSRGMLRRFGLAQVFLNEPEIVLLDEPTAGLDAEGFGVLAGMLARARERAVTVVIASHLLSDLHAHCDHLALLLDGTVARDGTPSELLPPGRTLLDLYAAGSLERQGQRV